ncbi:hypothetical protein OCAR_4546 [Afipia carboxidovorans OM5]|nr:hypothetical protein OCAR_4546 [Afipia carboxidovorans OM5]
MRGDIIRSNEHTEKCARERSFAFPRARETSSLRRDHDPEYLSARMRD